MLDISIILTLLFLGSIAMYWLDAIRVKELALYGAQKHCSEMQVQLLDQSVYLKRIWFKRNDRDQICFWRDFYFEFTVDGSDRYFGRVTLVGKTITAMQLDPHRLQSESQQHQ